MTQGPHYSKATFSFLKDLARHNDREWFASNKGRYEEAVKEPALRFIVDFAPRLKAISPHFRADPRGNGGSLFRIFRDTRFSKDKSPYKTHTGIQFRHDAGKDVHAPGFYLHLEPGACFMGLGIWRPDGGTLRTLREGLVEHPEEWKKVVGKKSFTRLFELMGDQLSRPPRGFDPAHPLVEDLKRKDFVASASLTEAQVTSAGFMDLFVQHCEAGAGFMAFLCKVLGLPF